MYSHHELFHQIPLKSSDYLQVGNLKVEFWDHISIKSIHKSEKVRARVKGVEITHRSTYTITV